MARDCAFTFQHYREILEIAQDHGYRFLLFQQPAHLPGDVIYLRHDVEMLPEAALQLARIEHKLGIQTTYCFLARTIFYNLFSGETAEAVFEIQSLGHQIALHFDAGIYAGEAIVDSDELSRLVQNEITLMETFFDQKVDVVSFHNPPDGVFNREFPRFINTYQPAFFSSIKYLSDSNMQWREGCLCQVLREKQYPRMQVLTHPYFWQEEPGALIERIRWSLDYRLGRMKDEMMNTNRVLQLWRGMPGERI